MFLICHTLLSIYIWILTITLLSPCTLHNELSSWRVEEIKTCQIAE